MAIGHISTLKHRRISDLGGAKPIMPGGRSVSCSLLNQQPFRLEEEFEVNHGLHRTPLVRDCLEALQYVSPSVARSAQCHLPNKTYGLRCAAQYDWRARADTQLGINWKVRHGHLTTSPLPQFHPAPVCSSNLRFGHAGNIYKREWKSSTPWK
jgi:hypothetical protein